MKTKEIRFKQVMGLLLALVLSCSFIVHGAELSLDEIDAGVKELIEDGDLPGVSLIIVKGDDDVIIKSYGYTDLKAKSAVTPETLFELASCSKSFTALAVVQLEAGGLIQLDAPVSRYLPWFSVEFEGEKRRITLRQLLHHTSGIPWKTVSWIPRGAGPAALEKTVRKLVGLELARLPGSQFEYATINYDILGLIIEKVSEMSFEEYMARRVFQPLGLDYTSVGQHVKNPLMARGYKIGFFAPRRYDSPVFRGNNPAAYVVSNGLDIGRWLKLHLGLIDTDMKDLILMTQRPDRTIPPFKDDFSSYAMGWKVFQKGKGEFSHSGLNPNFSSFMGFRPARKIGVAVLANVNSNYPAIIGNYVLDALTGKESAAAAANFDSGVDKPFSVISFVLVLFLLLMLLLLISIFRGIMKRARRFQGLNKRRVILLAWAVLLIIPVLVGVYLLPGALADFTWDAIVVWAPVSLPVGIVLLLAAMAVTFTIFLFSLFFPHKNSILNATPFVIILSSISGLLNSAAIFIVIQAFSNAFELEYLVFYFCVTILLYFSISKIVRRRLVLITNNLVFDMRVKLIKKMLATLYQNFEKLDTGRIYATINNDTNRIGNSPGTIVQVINSTVVVFCIFVYLITISFIPTMVTLGVVALIATVYTVFSKRVQVFWEEARDTQNVFMKLIDGLVKGYKELSLHFDKKNEYKEDLEGTCETYRQKRNQAFFRFINLNVFFESVLLSVLGFVSIGFPRIFPEIHIYTLISFVMVLFYVVGPIANIIGGIPNLMQIRVSWRRIQGFIKDIPGEWTETTMAQLPVQHEAVRQIKTAGVEFEYEQKDEHEKFAVGPIDLEAGKGEIIFIIGGNGSGKTTLAKLLTGLYKPARGEISINGRVFDNSQLGELYSTVFSDYHLFEKLYNVDVSTKTDKIEKYLKLLELDDKVHLKNGSFSTIDLSGGQRKRLALLLCYLEDYPIYLFDEWAADQDPTFRKFFYRELLLKMKEEGKIVLAITHDENYFDVADKIIKMDMGRASVIKNG